MKKHIYTFFLFLIAGHSVWAQSGFECFITCPNDITVANKADTCGALVTFSVSTGNRGSEISYSTPSGSTFLIGATAVTVTVIETATLYKLK